MSSSALKSLILAGGKGTRLRPLTYAMAKQLVPVANKPILYYGLDELYKAGIREYGFIISPETGDSIKDAVAHWAPPDVQLEFIPQAEPLGLAHAVKIAEPFLGDSDFIMYLGDNLINVDLRELIIRFQAEASDALILLKAVEDPSSFGVADLGPDKRVIRLVEKPKNPTSNLALIGVYIFTPRIFQAIQKIKPSWRGELEITDAIQQLLTDNAKVLSHIHEGWWLDTGKKDDLLAANRTVLSYYLTETTIKGRLSSQTQVNGLVEVDQNAEVINSTLNGPLRIGRGSRIVNSVIGPNTSIGTGCEVSDSRIENSVLLDGCTITSVDALIQESLIGNQCIIKGTQRADKSYRLLLANHSEVQVP